MHLDLQTTHTHTHPRMALKRHLPSCDPKAIRCWPPMNIKYKHSPNSPPLASISCHYLGIINTLASPYPILARKMNLSSLYKIICQHYISCWIMYESSRRVPGRLSPGGGWATDTRFYSWLLYKGGSVGFSQIFGNDIHIPILALRNTFSNWHKGFSNEDVVSLISSNSSFDLIVSSERMLKLSLKLYIFTDKLSAPTRRPVSTWMIEFYYMNKENGPNTKRWKFLLLTENNLYYVVVWGTKDLKFIVRHF